MMADDIPQWAAQKAIALTSAEPDGVLWSRCAEIAFARYISTHEEAPVDPLLPCPFCGGNASYGTIHYSPGAAIGIGDGKQLEYHTANCTKCGASLGSDIGFAMPCDARVAWNRRAK